MPSIPRIKTSVLRSAKDWKMGYQPDSVTRRAPDHKQVIEARIQQRCIRRKDKSDVPKRSRLTFFPLSTKEIMTDEPLCRRQHPENRPRRNKSAKVLNRSMPFRPPSNYHSLHLPAQLRRGKPLRKYSLFLATRPNSRHVVPS